MNGRQIGHPCLLPLLVPTVRPFGVTIDLASRHPWDAMKRDLASVSVKEFYFGLICIAVGKRDRVPDCEKTAVPRSRIVEGFLTSHVRGIEMTVRSRVADRLANQLIDEGRKIKTSAQARLAAPQNAKEEAIAEPRQQPQTEKAMVERCRVRGFSVPQCNLPVFETLWKTRVSV